ncbi:MAG: NAD(P)H-binding protein [Bacteroidetes bacterium]|nr:NAD(P)H-binding protein [Bacteroidota bacterium]
MNSKTALVFGATGLTGSYLLKCLLKDSRYEKVKIFIRRENDLPSNKKLEVHIVKISSLEKYTELLRGDDLFCCLGTTISKAGSKEAFRKVDFEYPLKVAEQASKNNISSFIVISSLGADINSSNFYLMTPA